MKNKFILFCLLFVKLINLSSQDFESKISNLDPQIKTIKIDSFLRANLVKLKKNDNLILCEKFANELLTIKRDFNDTFLINAYKYLGIIYFEKNNYRESFVYFEKAKENIIDKKKLIDLYMSIQRHEIPLLYKLGNFKLLFKTTYELINYFESIKNQELVLKMKFNLFGFFTTGNELDSAKKLLKDVKKYYDLALKNGDIIIQMNYFNNLAVYFEYLNLYDSSLIYYHKALELEKKYNLGENQLALIVFNIVNLSILSNNTANINSCFDVLNNSNYEKKSYYFLMILNTVKGFSFYYKNNYTKCIDYFLVSDSISEKIGDAKVALMVDSMLYLSYSQIGNYNQAIHFLEKFYKLRILIYKNNSSADIENVLLNHEIEKKNIANSLLNEKNEKIKFKNVFLIFLLIVSVLLLLILMYLKSRNLRAKIVKSELKSLRLQLNPHYLSNALLSVQNLIIDQKTEEALNILAQFGKVMRSFLNNSESQFIPLNQEIKTLYQYLELESGRFNKNFNFNIYCNDINPDDLNTIFIPTMLIQPFVENAIIHGLQKKNDFNKQLDIFFYYNNELKCEIIDNGIGRKIAKEENKRKSFGNFMLQERFKLYNDLLKVKSKIEIQDLYSGEIQCGTKVILILPYKIIVNNDNSI